MPARFARIGDPWEGMNDAVGSLAGLLEQAERDEAAGLPDAPWPPHYEKQEGEDARVQPSKRRAPGGPAGRGASGRRCGRPERRLVICAEPDRAQEVDQAADRDRPRQGEERGDGGS